MQAFSEFPGNWRPGTAGDDSEDERPEEEQPEEDDDADEEEQGEVDAENDGEEDAWAAIDQTEVQTEDEDGTGGTRRKKRGALQVKLAVRMSPRRRAGVPSASSRMKTVATSSGGDPKCLLCLLSPPATLPTTTTSTATVIMLIGLPAMFKTVHSETPSG